MRLTISIADCISRCGHLSMIFYLFPRDLCDASYLLETGKRILDFPFERFLRSIFMDIYERKVGTFGHDLERTIPTDTTLLR